MFKEFEYLPWSGRRYRINVVGELLERDDKIIGSISNGEKTVEIDWVLGRREYNLALLVLYSFGLVRLPDYLIDEVEPLYRDGNKNNLSPVNLIYKFKNGPLEAEGYPGFFHIPFYVNYAISRNGELINIHTGKMKTWSITSTDGVRNQTGGYHYSRVVNDEGYSKTLFRHRAMCLTFKEYDFNVDSLVVNHIDGNPSNNDLDNLEFVTYSRNNLHAVETGLRGDNKPVLSRNLLTGEIKRFFSKGEAARHYNRPVSGYIHNRLTKSFGKVFPDMLLFKFDDDTPWPDIDLTTEKVWVTEGVPLYGRNVFTGEIVIFESCPHASVLTGVKPATVLSHVKNNLLVPVSGWNFRYVQPGITWPQHNEKLLRIYSKHPIYPSDGAIIFDVLDNTEVFYESVALALSSLGITRSVFHHHAKNGKLLKNRYRIKLYRIREHIKVSLQSDL